MSESTVASKSSSSSERSTRQIAFLTRHNWPWLRQTDNGAGHHGALTIGLEPDAGDDWIVVYDDISNPVRSDVPLHRRILFVTEPLGQKRYRSRFTNQFGTIVSPYRVPGFRGRWVISHPAINWFYGVRFGNDGKATSRIGLTELREMPVPADKAKRISVVCSTKAKLPRQRARLRLIERLTQAFPDAIDVFGKGFRTISDKADVIAPYRYHLALENNDCPHFWTEKLADAYLGYTLPIFSGCRNVVDYFPERSMIPLFDIEDHEKAVSSIGELLEQDPWAERLDAIRVARTNLIERENLFSLIARLTEDDVDVAAPSQGDKQIRPGSQCGMISSILRGLGRSR